MKRWRACNSYRGILGLGSLTMKMHIFAAGLDPIWRKILLDKREQESSRSANKCTGTVNIVRNANCEPSPVHARSFFAATPIQFPYGCERRAADADELGSNRNNPLRDRLIKGELLCCRSLNSPSAPDQGVRVFATFFPDAQLHLNISAIPRRHPRNSKIAVRPG